MSDIRLDVKVNVTKSIRCSRIPSVVGTTYMAGRGDWVRWSGHKVGRVVGSVVDPEDGKVYLVVVMLHLGGCCSEFWVSPDDVEEICSDKHSTFAAKAAWVFSDAFLSTPPDVARRCFHTTVEEMVMPNRSEAAEASRKRRDAARDCKKSGYHAVSCDGDGFCTNCGSR